jgi:TonB-dependent starch-binding outer membrane protein SusC
MKIFLHYLFRTLIVLWLTTTFFNTAQAQGTVKISGKIIDNKQQTVIGATILVKGTTNGTVTNENGEFSIQTDQKLPVTVVVSLVGYSTQEVDVYEQDPVSITLEEVSNKLNEVVVVGYGTQRRKDLTGSIASVSVSNLKQTPVSSFDNALHGQVAGVHVTQTSGQPGAAISIQIRGGNSINGGNEPLYVIDGFPVYNDNSDVNAGAISGASINGLSSINANDIESIDILKDASATAIYGARGANGVVVITTKKGQAGQNNITYENYYGIQQVGKKIDLLNAQQYAQLKNDAITTTNAATAAAGGTTVVALPFSLSQIDSLGNVHRNWQDAAFRTAPVQNHQLTIAGGDEKTHYAISGNYFKQSGIIINSDFTRYSGRINLDRKVKKNLKVGENLTLSQTAANEAPSGILNTVLAVRPDFPIYNDDGSFTLKQPGEAALGNPIATLTLQKNLTKTLRLFGNAYGEYKIIDGLTAKVSFGIDKIRNNQYQYIPSTLYEGATVSGAASQGNKTVDIWLNENTLNYNKKIGDHSLDVLVGYTQQQYKSGSAIASQDGFTTDDLLWNNLASGSTYVSSSSTSTAWQLASFLGRVNYNLKEKYYVTFTGRRDGSSRFGANNKWGFFPSGAVSWNVNSEDFLKDIKALSNLKLRYSLGRTGNQEIGVYKSIAAITNYNTILGDALSIGGAPSSIANPDLTWEKTTQSDLGLNLGLFDNRISLDVDAYYKKTTDLLLSKSIPATSGQLTAFVNSGSVQNKGIEIALNTDNITGKFTWSTNVIFSLNRNKVLDLGDVSYVLSDPFIAKVGYPVGSFYVLKTNGLYTADDIANGVAKYKTVTLPGYQKFVDVNGDGSIGIANDRVIVGNSQPKFLYGITNHFSYGIFDLNFLFEGSYGNKIYNYTRAYLDLGTGYTNSTTELLGRWRSATVTDATSNTNTIVPRAQEDPAVLPSDRFIEDASYLRLKNITLGISLPTKHIKSLRIKQFRIYVSGQNLKTWTKYSGYDPEASRNEQTTLSQGYDNAVYPVSKTILGGLSLTF